MPNSLITGASSGLGRGLALQLAREGHDVAVTARREPLLRAVAAEIEALGRRCIVLPADLCDAQRAHEVVDAAAEALGGLDLVWLNAGGGVAHTLQTTTADTLTWLMRTNYDTMVNVLVPSLPHLQRSKGVLAYTGSPAGYLGLPKSGAYSAAKAAGRMLMDTCRAELYASGIDMVAVYPGFADTPGLSREDIPYQALIISESRAVNEMMWAYRHRVAHHMFPRRIAWLIRLARVLPIALRTRVLAAIAAS
ncbi:MAG: SDR family NAD(P)-dependent oxidoreductase [Myxococcota bacterium]